MKTTVCFTFAIVLVCSASSPAFLLQENIMINDCMQPRLRPFTIDELSDFAKLKVVLLLLFSVGVVYLACEAIFQRNAARMSEIGSDRSQPTTTFFSNPEIRLEKAGAKKKRTPRMPRLMPKRAVDLRLEMVYQEGHCDMPSYVE